VTLNWFKDGALDFAKGIYSLSISTNIFEPERIPSDEKKQANLPP